MDVSSLSGQSAADYVRTATWAIHKGYVLTGSDPALKHVASTALPIVERHIASLRAATPAGM